MSLLLDALKKAARDKEAASAGKTGTSDPVTADAPDLPAPDNHAVELTLDELPAEESPPVTPREVPAEKPLSLDRLSATPNTVSDEALQVLIYKTNHEHRRNRRLVWGGAIGISALVLVASGMYFFNEMQQQVESLERKHRLNMQAVRSEPVKAKKTLNTDTAQEQSASSNVVVRKPVKKAPVTTGVKTSNTAATVSATASQPQQTNQISITRGETRDPVSELLNRAWTAYNKADYSQAGNVYQQVLQREKNNRDALMGLGAIAIKNGDLQVARQFYNKLLELDPRDPVANAAMINLNTTEADSLSESKLQILLRQNPHDPHLHYALGNKYAAQQRWPEAQVEYLHALEGDSTNADYAYNLAISLDHSGKPEQAAHYYRAALDYSQNSNISFSPDAVTKRLDQIKP